VFRPKNVLKYACQEGDQSTMCCAQMTYISSLDSVSSEVISLSDGGSAMLLSRYWKQGNTSIVQYLPTQQFRHVLVPYWAYIERKILL